MGLLSFFWGLVGCDPQRIAELEEGVATEADVRARFGEPEKIWSAADMASTPQSNAALAVVAAAGARTLEYNRQPQGAVNYMITIGADGKMTALRQVLTPQNFAAVRSLVTTGIQSGHMKMHLANILNHLGANAAEAAEAMRFFEGKTVSFTGVREYLEGMRAKTAAISNQG